MLRNLDDCQNIFEEMEKFSALFSALKQDDSDSTSKNIISNCKLMLTKTCKTMNE
jgi:hypothetical protein